VNVESKIALNCPHCEEPIYEPLGWFKQVDSVCPACDKRLIAEQFADVVADLEQAINTNIDEMVSEPQKSGCCGSGSSCGS
jgi:hypothetical protein